MDEILMTIFGSDPELPSMVKSGKLYPNRPPDGDVYPCVAVEVDGNAGERCAVKTDNRNYEATFIIQANSKKEVVAIRERLIFCYSAYKYISLVNHSDGFENVSKKYVQLVNFKISKKNG